MDETGKLREEIGRLRAELETLRFKYGQVLGQLQEKEAEVASLKAQLTPSA